MSWSDNRARRRRARSNVAKCLKLVTHDDCDDCLDAVQTFDEPTVGLSHDSQVQHDVVEAESEHNLTPMVAPKLTCGNELEDSDSDDLVESDSVDSGDEGFSFDLADGLRNWALRFGVTLVALSALLTLLRMHHPSLPKDARTLLKTARKCDVVQKAGGLFYHFGLLSSIKLLLDKFCSLIPDNHTLKMQLNIDGLPLHKSSSMQFWPVLGLLKDFNAKPVIISLFCGSHKPSSLEEFLNPIIEEINQLRNGFEYLGKRFFLIVTGIICDAPARAFVKAVKSHSGYSGCDKCDQTGCYNTNRMTFPESQTRLRTDKMFRSQADEDHHVGSSPFVNTYLDMIMQFPHDYMHLVCLGVMRRLLHFWLSGPLRCRLASLNAANLSEKLLSLKQFIPVEFNRKPRSLAEVDRWKATEFRMFLLYCGPVCLNGILSQEVYDNFLLLFVSVFMLSSRKYVNTHIEYTKQLLILFTEHFAKLYGSEMVVYNVHSLIHLPDDAKLHGHLDNFSGFPFENYLGQLKKLLRKAHLPLSQVVRRMSEGRCFEFTQNKAANVKFSKNHLHGPLPCDIIGSISQFQEMFFDNICFKTTSGDNCVSVNGTIGLVRNILCVSGEAVIVYEVFSVQECFFQYPCLSSELGIYILGSLSGILKWVKVDCNVCKYVILPHHEKFVGIPLLHN